MLQHHVLQLRAVEVEEFPIQEAIFRRRSKWGGRRTVSESGGDAGDGAHESEQREHSVRAVHSPKILEIKSTQTHHAL